MFDGFVCLGFFVSFGFVLLVCFVFFLTCFLGRKKIQNCKLLSYGTFGEAIFKCEGTQLTVLYMEYAAKTWNKDCCLEK